MYDRAMPQSDVIQILLSHDRWATAQLLDACSKLSEDQFHRRFEMGPGALHDTLAHILGAMGTWTDTLAGREPGPRIDFDGKRRTVDELRTLHEAVCDALAAEARRRALDEIVVRKLRDGTTRQFTRAAVLTHVATHGMHHRAQCLNMLRQLEVKPLPPSSVSEWTWIGDRS